MPAFVLHRKVKAAVLATAVVLLLDGFQQVTDLYPNNPLIGVLRLVVPAIAAYLTKAENA